MISRRQVSFIFTREAVRVVDLRSACGTHVNAQLVRDAPLLVRDTIYIADFSLSLAYDGPCTRLA